MKKTLLGCIAVLVAVLLISACNKFGDLSGSNGQVVATSYHVKISQPDSLLLVGAGSTDFIKWSVVPAGFDSIITKKNAAEIFFKKAGTYQVKAVDNTVTATSATLTVSDSVYQPKTVYSYTQLTGDQVTLVPHYYSSGDSTFISLVAQTKSSYCGISKLIVADSLISAVSDHRSNYLARKTSAQLIHMSIAARLIQASRCKLPRHGNNMLLQYRYI